MDDQRKKHIDPKGPKQRNGSKQLLTHNLPIDEILTAQIREEIYYSLKSRWLFPEEQKGCHKGSRGTADLHYIDHHILNVAQSAGAVEYTDCFSSQPVSWIWH